eukprot:COSAG02_NODE_3678_length_6391_cov_3.177845_7_plen_54_part_00
MHAYPFCGIPVPVLKYAGSVLGRPGGSVRVCGGGDHPAGSTDTFAKLKHSFLS